MDQTKIDALRAQPVSQFAHLIDGKHVPASDGGTMDIISPIAAFLAELEATLTRNVQTHSIPHHINDAVSADKAHEIFDSWCADGTVRR